MIVNNDQVEIRYVVPTGPKGETTPFCHVRLDYLEDHLRLNGPWPYKLSDLYYEPAATAAVQKIAAEEHTKVAA